MAQRSITMRQIMDWRAAVLAGIVAGLVFLVLQMGILAGVAGASPWIVLRMVAAMVMGQGVLPPPASFDPVITIVALLINFVLSILFALLIAFVLHRWGLLVGIVGGALFGLALYAINYYTFTLFFPWFFPMRSWLVVLSHIIFGATAGGIYEAFEHETYVVEERN
ncbi:MAG: hypothetical protein NT075_14885 [Chloroflexi bacterium]|nr:hypothetical protein [Chloroflexota bacterium]